MITVRLFIIRPGTSHYLSFLGHEGVKFVKIKEQIPAIFSITKSWYFIATHPEKELSILS